MRDHAEVGGNSPDMKQTDWNKAPTPFTMFTENSMTPIPVPRMGHHFITPTMAMTPGHYAHPVYQRLYDLHHSCNTASISASSTAFTRDPLVWFSTPTASYRPSDVHGGAFTLLTETKVRYDGYGILAAVGAAGTTNSQGTHEIVLEAAGAYTLRDHFPDPLEVGAYQIVIQPNLYKQQFKGFHRNHSTATKAPYESGTLSTELTGQQVNTVIAIEHTVSAAGAVTLILAEATMADTRGCEVMMNEVMLDISPDPSEQFTQLPTLALFNPIGVNETASPSLTRRSLPYRPGTFERSTPGYTLTVPWWAQLHKDGPSAASAVGFRGIEHHKPDDYYQFCRATYGAVGSQITLAGYPSSFVDIYEAHRRVRSLNPHAIAISDNGASTITVDDCELFPVVPYYGEQLEYIDSSGVRQTATYTNRTGTAAHVPLAGAHTFEGVTGSAAFWAGMVPDVIIRLTGPYNVLTAGDIFKSSKQSMITRILPQVLHGSRDTNSLHMADAYLCLWHPNLGRPYTYYGDNVSRSFYDGAGTADNAVDEKGLNNLPEHFETIRYQEFFYNISKGPLAFDMKWLKPQDDGTALAPTDPLLVPFEAQGDATNFFSGFWPGGSRGGAAGSRLDGYNVVNVGWGGKDFDTDCNSYDFLDTTTGLRTRTYSQMNSASEFDRNRCFGWRFAVRPAYNRPRWAPSVRGWLEVDVVGGADTGVQAGYYHGPFIQQDSSTWVSKADAGLSAPSPSFNELVTGIIERQTEITAMLGNDQLGRQVRYADGRRITRAYGCPLRILRNPSTARRMFPGDSAGKNISELADAHRYYLVDWWGNTRGEDMRRFPVRAFGVRPAWDPEAYEDGGIGDEPTARNLFHTIAGEYPPIMRGNTNSTNSSIDPVDWFNPKNAMRVGDSGSGRGVRWPTAFNEWKLQAVSADTSSSGLVTSFSTAEPPFTVGFLRPNDNILDAREIPRGISARLGVDEAGLLKPEAVVGQNIEDITSYSRAGGETLVDPVSRVAPRVGLDADTTREIDGGQHVDYVAVSTQAHSLHTDRSVGQRTYISGALDLGSQTLGDFDLTTLSWASNPNKGVIRMSDSHAFWPLGGTYVLEARNYVQPFDDTGWGSDLLYSPVTTNLLFWLKVDAITGKVDGDTVQTWEDSSVNNKDFTNTGGSSTHPTYKTNILNGRPILRFDGGDHVFRSYEAALNPQELTIFVVVAPTLDTGGTQTIVSWRNNTPIQGANLMVEGANDAYRAQIGTDTDADGLANTWTIKDTTAGSVDYINFDLLTCRMEDTDTDGLSEKVLLRQDGLEILDDVLTSGVTAGEYVVNTSINTQIAIGSATQITGDIAEILFYDRTLTQLEMERVEGYLALKYALTLDASHPYAGYTTSNPYQDSNHRSASARTNATDKTVRFLLRPNRVLDNRHIEMMRAAPKLVAGTPQKDGSGNYNNAYRSLAGGKYGLFNYDAPGGRTGTTSPTSPPYAPVYDVDTGTPTAADSVGPNIPGAEATGFINDVTQTVGRVYITENTLEHFRSDAPRRRTVEENGARATKPDYAIQPRYSQSLHPKGEGGISNFNTGDHTGE